MNQQFLGWLCGKIGRYGVQGQCERKGGLTHLKTTKKQQAQREKGRQLCKKEDSTPGTEVHKKDARGHGKNERRGGQGANPAAVKRVLGQIYWQNKKKVAAWAK